MVKFWDILLKRQKRSLVGSNSIFKVTISISFERNNFLKDWSGDKKAKCDVRLFLWQIRLRSVARSSGWVPSLGVQLIVCINKSSACFFSSTDVTYIIFIFDRMGIFIGKCPWYSRDYSVLSNKQGHSWSLGLQGEGYLTWEDMHLHSPSLS